MTETLAALLFAHTLADFVFQTTWMAANKRKPLPLLAHIAVVFVTVIAVSGSFPPALLALAAAHAAIDAAKAWSPWKGLWPFLADQAFHLVSLIVVAVHVPDLWANGVWSGKSATGILGTSLWSGETASIAPGLMALVAGFILTTRAGGFAVGLYMDRWQNDWQGGLPNGGRAIGHLERALIFLLILTNQAGGIGFLIAAKSVLRFSAISDDRKFSEYVIIGTLASFGWAIAASLGTVMLLQYLTPLGIPDLTP
jgi:Protein of unknown function (DUF3307)